MPFSIASFTMRSGSISPATACDAHAPTKQQRRGSRRYQRWRRYESLSTSECDAYQRLALYANRPPNPEFSRMLETTVANIQIFGTAEEIGHLHAFLDQWAQKEAA